MGPDLASIGASAQPDYLVESLYEPGKKIKENYHSLVVVTDRGEVLTGVKVRETDSELILRDANNQELRVPLESIEESRDGGSLMPAALMDSLTRDESVHLIRFLSELGKIGDYALPKRQFIRSWRALANNDYNREQVRRLRVTGFVPGDARLQWQSVTSRVNGTLPASELPEFQPHSTTGRFSFAQFDLLATTGQQTIRFNSTEGIHIWVNGKSQPVTERLVIQENEASTTVTVAIETTRRKTDLLVEQTD